jgi:hypothetical protein
MINKKMQDVIERALLRWDNAFDVQNTEAMIETNAQLDGIRHLLRAMGIRFNYYLNHTCASSYKLAIYENME